MQALARLQEFRRSLSALSAATDADSYCRSIASASRSFFPTALLIACQCIRMGRSSSFAIDAGGSPILGWSMEDADLLFANRRELAAAKVLRRPLTSNNRTIGKLLVALPKDASDDDEAWVREWSEQVACHAAMSAAGEESADDESLFVMADAMGSIFHETKNILNGVLLHIAVMQRDPATAEKTKPGLVIVRDQCFKLADMMKEVESSRGRSKAPASASDLAGAFRSAAAQTALVIDWQLPSELPQVAAPGSDLARLATLLLRNIASLAARLDAPLSIAAQFDGSVVRVRIETHVVLIPSAQMTHFFEPLTGPIPGHNGIELSACRGLVRRQHGSIRAELLPAGGLALHIELPRAKA